MELSAADIRRFWSKVDVKGADECWLWCWGLYGDKYGSFVVSGRVERTNRVACTIAHGPAPEDKPFALHARHCNHPACCNGAHLRWGTAKENAEDKVVSGRCWAGKREPSFEEAVDIKKEARLGSTVKELAERHNVGIGTVRSILRDNRYGV